MTQEKCNCFEHEGDNPQCPVHNPKQDDQQGEQE